MATSSQIYKYTQVIVPGPDGYTTYANLPQGSTELCTLDGETYVTVPATAGPMPEQHAEVTLTPVTLDPLLRERIKKASPLLQRIDQQLVERIRAVYSLEDEQYFSRIGVGAALGVYNFEPGEMEALLAFGAHVEDCRQQMRQQRAALGL